MQYFPQVATDQYFTEAHYVEPTLLIIHLK